MEAPTQETAEDSLEERRLAVNESLCSTWETFLLWVTPMFDCMVMLVDVCVRHGAEVASHTTVYRSGAFFGLTH